MCQSRGIVPRVRQRAHEPEDGPGAQGVEPRSACQRSDRIVVSRFPGCPGGGGLGARIPVEVSDPRPLLFHPPGELGELRKGEAL